MSDVALVIMARYPEKGKIKTRLARSIGEEGTLCLYQAFLTDLAWRFANWTCHLHWAYTPPEADFNAFVASLATLDASSISSFAQEGPDLGARLYHAFRFTQSRQFQRTILIGSDSPQISRTIITQAQEALDSVDVVLGPAEDGGYYLIAMKEPHDLFSDIPMSTDAVLRMTLERAQRLGLSVHLLEPLFDVDELPELLRLVHLLQERSYLAMATAAQIAQLKKESIL
ncbi:MAG TPA: TIGR04282 family arsenosugar biosynthesis glycosyltransferase [Ktedonosporobacter sp.]|jgi:rSAM/selenodomain-associated transferase 1|nr:TIGR04282 family arsenosugar biosynthesis glycosyltransferase [Ktedonosporobacter sp.]